jgi:DNA end-binding protein Ku
MRYADEVLAREGLVPDAEGAEPSERELAMARQLVDALADGFDPDRYHDEYREQLMDLIQRKAAGEQIVAEPTVEEPGKVLDLMAALEASLARTGTGEPTGDAAPDEPAPAKPTKKRAARSRKSA